MKGYIVQAPKVHVSAFIKVSVLLSGTNWNHVSKMQDRIFSCSLIKWNKIRTKPCISLQGEAAGTELLAA